MIRKLEESDLPRIMQIWLSANKEAHGFIEESYWDENFEAVKAALPCAEVYIHENAEAEPDGFIGLNGGHIAGHVHLGDGGAHPDGNRVCRHDPLLDRVGKNDMEVRPLLRQLFQRGAVPLAGVAAVDQLDLGMLT